MNTQANTTSSWAERNGFSHWALAFVWLILCITVFQVFAGLLVGLGYLLFSSDLQSTLADGDGGQAGIMEALSNNMDLLFVTNSTWQILFLAVGTFLFVRLQTGAGKRMDFLRTGSGRNPFTLVSLAVFMVIAIQPSIW
ncbi:MAG: hypothetical protein R3222_09360, partial [Balneolaceae bacterium]|nr:hypothetical protein [Balneolaceae bacterium]